MPLSRTSIFPPLSARSHSDADVETSLASMSAEIRTRRPASVSTRIVAFSDAKSLTVEVVDRNDSVAPAAVVGEPSAVMTYPDGCDPPSDHLKRSCARATCEAESTVRSVDRSVDRSVRRLIVTLL